MTTGSALVDVSSFTTTAKLNAWALALSTAIKAVGLTQTADTGQVTWGAIAHPGATNTKVGYEVYRFNDSIQSASPIYFRLDYGTGSATSGANPCTWLTVGTGSDGAGNITGTAAGMAVAQANTAATASTNTATTVGASYSTTAGALTILAGQYTASGGTSGAWVIGRSCDTSGNPTSAATVVYRNISASASTATWTIVGNLLSPATNYASRNVGAANFSPSVAITAGTTVAVHKNYVIAPTPIPTLAAITVNAADALQWSTLTVAPFGSTTHKYLVLGGAFAPGFDSQASANSVGCLIWE